MSVPVAGARVVPRGGVAFVNMPFHGYHCPSIALGILKAELKRRAVPAHVYELTFELLPFIDGQDLERAATIYRFLAEYWPLGLGEWLFSTAMAPAAEARYVDWLRDQWQRLASCGAPADIVASLRRAAPRFIDAMARRVVAGGHDVVGFTASYFQTQAAAAMARRIKELSPHTRIMVGGASANDVMGVAMLKAFPAIDLVCHTEAEGLIEPIVRALRRQPGCTLDDLPGISYRTSDGLLVDGSSREAPLPDVDTIPLPDYDDYFEQVAGFIEQRGNRLKLTHELPVETSRGCWWGQKSHCTFCGLNSNRMRFRGRSPEAAAESILELYRRYRAPRFFAVDTIIDYRYFDAFTRILAEANEPIRLAYEVKANLKKHEIRALAEAGVAWVQPGLESLSTRVLQVLMKKGTTAIQNVQALKWFAEHGIRVRWNLFPTYPGDRLDDYQHLPALMPRLMHLPPPDYNPLQVQRFSPQHRTPEAHGLRILGVHPGWRFAFHDVPPEVLPDLTYMFEWDEPGRDPAIDEFASSRIRPLVDAWKRHELESGCTLWLLHGPRTTAVVYGELDEPDRVTLHSGAGAWILRAAGAIRAEAMLERAFAGNALERPGDTEEEQVDQASFEFFLRRWQETGAAIERIEVEASTAAVLESLAGEGLLMREAGKVLSLPVNAVRMLHREMLAGDPAAFLEYLLLPSPPAAAPRLAPPDLIPLSSLLGTSQ